MKTLVTPLLLALILISCDNYPGQVPEVFDLTGKSTLFVENTTDDTTHIALDNWYFYPSKHQKIDTSLVPGQKATFSLIVQGYTYSNLLVDDKAYNLFSTPGSTDSLIIVEEKQGPSFKGDLCSINRFLLEKTNRFGTPNSEWILAINEAHMLESYSDVRAVNDSSMQVHLEDFDSYNEGLPEWYMSFEKKRLKYLNAYLNLNSLMYRKAMLNTNDTVPDDFLQSVVKDLPVIDETMIGHSWYLQFLMDYVSYSFDPKLEKERSKTPDSVFHNSMFKVVDSVLTGKVKDAYNTLSLAMTLDRRRYDFKDEWLDHIENNEYRTFLEDLRDANPILPNGATIPYFYLADEAGNYFEPSSFQDSVVMINFWNPGCKPCIKEFSYENELVKKYSNAPVKIVNVCVGSNRENWSGVLGKHDLKAKNLIAENNWSTMLSQKFDINGYPHSVLVDANGLVVQNKCPRASAPEIVKMIDELLAKQNM